jgi:hypothetical protein
VYDPFQQWRIASPDIQNSEAVSIIADAGGIKTKLYCQPPVDDRQICLVSPNFPVQPETAEQIRALAYDDEDGYEFKNTATNAALAIRYETTAQVDGSSEASWGRLYCRLNLVNVTKASFSVHQIVPCKADWVAQAKRLRAYVEGLFVEQ